MTNDAAPLYRRPRMPDDGPQPMYILMSGQRAAMPPQFIELLQRDAEETARLVDEDMGNAVAAFLESELSGTSSIHALDGLLRESVPWDGELSPALLDVPDECDLCGRSVVGVGWIIDGCTTEGLMWSWMCPGCFALEGCGLGEGWGQLYQRTDDGQWLLCKGGTRATSEVEEFESDV